ncbi:hypothetical protein ETU09_00450 [Apibacter muscae]|uniref:Cell wall anchor protein n=1 Tax=Apibacter muscae TaxID=2509004 RepID=A0A563DKV1_9FLAO|nr:hypothetical protein [Apibacter muscae]TWP30503.1 hypothetical protein ETU09_00450 [Apibacter muscae]
MKEFLTSYLGEFLSVVIAGIGGWLFGRRKQNVELKSAEIDNEIKFADYYKSLLDDLSARYEKKYLDIEQLYTGKEKLLQDEISILRSKITMLERENSELKKRIKELEKQLKDDSNRTK